LNQARNLKDLVNIKLDKVETKYTKEDGKTYTFSYDPLQNKQMMPSFNDRDFMVGQALL